MRYFKPDFIFVALILVLTFSSSASAAMYIKPSSEVPLRRGMGIDYKILAVLQDGTEVTFLEEVESWAKVVTEEGKEGWILKRYLTEQKPLSERVSELQRENEYLQNQLTAINEEKSSYLQANAELTKVVETKERELQSISASYTSLRENSSDLLTLQKDLQQSKKLLTTLQQQFTEVSEERDQLKRNQNIRWFIAGAGTLFLGILLGLLKPNSKRTKSTLY